MKTCPICGKKLTSKQEKRGTIYCSYSCSAKSPERRELRRLFLEKNGIENISQLPQSREKAKSTSLSRYGVDNPAKSQEIKDKIENTCIERYGVRAYTNSEDFKEKTRKTNIEKYGSENAQSNIIIRERISKGIKRAYKENPSIRKNVAKKKKENHYKKFSNWSKYVVPLFSSEEYTGQRSGQIYKWKCVVCGHEWEQHIHTSNVGDLITKIPRCLKCFPYHIGFSTLEKEVKDFILEIYSGTIVENDRTIIKPLELDLFIPEKKIAIEFDGLFFHSELNGTSKFYHKEKTEKCLENGVLLIHIFEDEWVSKKNIVKDRIASIFGITNEVVFARSCIVKEIGTKEKNLFLDKNHLYGKDNSSAKIGLFFNNELVSVMTFGKPRFNKNYEWELIRYATKQGMRVVAGASKLLTFFLRNYLPKNILSYADRRYSTGNLYEKIGFSRIGISEPNYWWTKGQIKLSRYQCQKHKLPNILGDGFDKNMSEVENMYLNGWNKIYDCGNIVYAIENICYKPDDKNKNLTLIQDTLIF